MLPDPTRPYWETDADLARELEAAERYVRSRARGLDLRKLDATERIDFALMAGADVAGYLEVKCRPKYTSRALENLGTYMIAEHKWSAAEALCQTHRVPFTLLVAPRDGLYYLTLTAPFPIVERRIGGRTDRGDERDVEVCAFVPWEWFFRIDERETEGSRMGISSYDKAHVREILAGEGTWYTARLLRALAELLPHGDRPNQTKLFRAFPEECIAIYRYYGWPDAHIRNTFGIDPDLYDELRVRQEQLDAIDEP